MSEPYYRHHLFFCLNQREAGAACCANHGSPRLRDYAKNKVKSLGLAGPGGIRVNIAGCLDRCELGPTLVVYPEGVWYRYETEADIAEILATHVKGGGRVARLMMQ